jgi:hypothetical protein
MRFQLVAAAAVSAVLAGQSPAPAGPAVKWRGAVWASAVTEQNHSADGSLLFRPIDAGEDAASLDGLILGADVDLGKGWALRATLLGGHAGKLVNLAAGESGGLAIPEAQLVWTGAKDKLTLGRMNTYLGMEFLDGTQDIAASRGLLFSFVDPFTQVGLAWHHSFTTEWSADAFAFNGEDRVKDNNRDKTLGLGLNYNPGGATDKYLGLQFYRGAEQDGLGTAANTGAEGRKRERACFMGQWVWGDATLQWEATWGREAFAAGALAGANGAQSATWKGAGAIFRYGFSGQMGVFARAEYLQDDCGVRLAGDPTIGAAWGYRWKADLKATSFTLGLDRKFGPAFARLEVRQDGLNRDLTGLDAKVFKTGLSATLSAGASF